MRVYQARELNQWSFEDLWTLIEEIPLAEPITIVFDDGELVTDIRTTYISLYFWKLLLYYPNTPLLKHHHLSQHSFNSRSFNTLCSVIIQDIRLHEDVDFNIMSVQVEEILNTLYNGIVSNLGDWVETVDALDYVEILYHPEVERQRNECIRIGTPDAINKLYQSLPKVIEARDFLPHNAIKADVEMKNSKVNQVMQCVAVIGYHTDIHGRVFLEPVFESYGSGINNMAHLMMESRGAAKALLNQKDPIKDTEYFNRRLQLLDQSIVGLAHHLPKFHENIQIKKLMPEASNCGTRETLPWRIYPGNEENMLGRYYYEVDPLQHRNAPLYCIETKEQAKALVNKEIFLRSPLMCEAKKDNCVCHICFGQLADTVPRYSNLGHIAAYVLGAIISQKTLSTKHYTGSAEVTAIHLTPTDLKYVQLDPKHNELIYLLKKHLNGEVSVLCSMGEVADLTQAVNSDDVNELSVDKISALTRIGIKQVADDIEEIEWVTVSDASRRSALSTSMLNYIKQYGYKVLEGKFIEIDLAHWDFMDIAFQLPKKQLNTLDFMKRLAKMIEDGPKDIDKRGLDPSNPKDLATFLKKVTKFAWEEISVPMVYLETTILSTIVEDLANNDYRIGTNNDSRDFASVSNIIKHRSMGQSLAFEEQANVLVDTSSYDKNLKRTPHPYDALFYQIAPMFLSAYPEYHKALEEVWGIKV